MASATGPGPPLRGAVLPVLASPSSDQATLGQAVPPAGCPGRVLRTPGWDAGDMACFDLSKSFHAGALLECHKWSRPETPAKGA